MDDKPSHDLVKAISSVCLPSYGVHDSCDFVNDNKETFIKEKIEKLRESIENYSEISFIKNCLVNAIKTRKKYMEVSQQSFPVFLKEKLDNSSEKSPKTVHLTRNTTNSDSVINKMNSSLSMGHGIYVVKYEDRVFEIPSVVDYFNDYKALCSIVTEGPVKSFCFHQLKYLQNQFELHLLLNEKEEVTEQIKVPHRDFYNVKKVDTHIHLASCMNQKHLLQFIKRKMNECGNEIVIHRNGTDLTLSEVFESLNLTTYDLNVDALDVHADRNTFHRFDRFNLKYNPIGESRLREIFLKSNNKIKGKYFAELVKEVIADVETSKNHKVEYRISIYGKDKNEWSLLSDWLWDNEMFSDCVNWMIQIPRLFDVYFKNGYISNFQEMIENIFEPLFLVTLNPNYNEKLYETLLRIGGFDCVDDESKPETIEVNFLYPHEWKNNTNPSFLYYTYYLYANICSLNQLRKSLGLNTFQYRPHCGEAGSLDHLIISFLTAESINHGILLRKVPVVEYLYYLCQIGIAMSPLSNNSLFLEIHKNPFFQYFARGLNVSLSSDDPLQFHLTKEALMEEYSVAAQVWRLSSADLCEIARNSVIQSGFSIEKKKNWIGVNFESYEENSNDITKTNVPDIRVMFRRKLLLEERNNLFDQCQ